MSDYPTYNRGARIIKAGLIGAGALWVYDTVQPPFTNAPLSTTSLIALGFAGISAIALVRDLSTLIADSLNLVVANTPRGHKGKAGWARWKDIRKDIARIGFGPYWGIFQPHWYSKKRIIMADYASNAVTFGTAGSGKGVGVVLPTIMAIRESKLLTDLKGVQSCCLQAPLEQRGERFVMLNIGGMHHDMLGQGDCYNPLNIIADNYTRAGGLQDITSDTEEIAHQLYPESTEGGSDDKYWRDGSRDMISFAIQQCILVQGHTATLGDVNQLLNQSEQLQQEAEWAAGRLVDADGNPSASMPLEASPWVQHHTSEDVENYIRWYRAKASSTADLLAAKDDKTASSFLRGALQSLSPYNITTRAHKVLSKSTFRFSEMKEGDAPTTVSIIIDSSRLSTQSKIAGLLQWAFLTEMKRHNNTSRPVYFIADETTNFKIHELPTLQTWGREYGIRLHMFIQSISAYRSTYGAEAVNILLSETEIKQFLPGQREPDMLELIERQLGEQSIIAKNHNGSRDYFGVSGFGLAEDAVKLMSAEEIRRTDKTILFIRKNRPVLTDLPPIAAIHPWRKQIGINPFYGKPFLKRITLRIGHRKGTLLLRPFRAAITLIKGGRS